MKPMFQNLLVAISGSEASINAAKYAIMIAKQYQCSLTAVYVVDTATLKQLVMTKIFVEDESEEYERSLLANGERYLAFFLEMAKQKGVKARTALRKGAVYTEILRESEEAGCDLIILGGWERQRSGREIISESHREILFHSKASVLVVKEQDIERMYKQL